MHLSDWLLPSPYQNVRCAGAMCPGHSTGKQKQQTSTNKPPTNRYESPPENPESHSAWHPLPPPSQSGTWPLRGLLSKTKYLLYPSSPARLSLMGPYDVGGRAKLSLAPTLRLEGSKQLAAALQLRRGQAGARAREAASVPVPVPVPAPALAPVPVHTVPAAMAEWPPVGAGRPL
jgi:hypothetical protein